MFSPRAFTADDRSTAEYTAALPFFTRGSAGGDTNVNCTIILDEHHSEVVRAVAQLR